MLAFMAVLVAFLLVEDYLIGAELRGYLLKREMEHSRLELELLGGAALESLLRRDYVAVGRFMERWGSQHENVISLEAIAPNGFMLSEYRRPGDPGDKPFEIEKTVSHDGRELVYLRLRGDSSAIEAMVDRIMGRLFAGSVIFMSALGLALWFSQKRTALDPLEREIRLRQDAEQKLTEARDGLEREVEERTEDLKSELQERKRAEQQVLEREKEINLLLDSMAEAVYGIDTEGRCTFTNLSCLRMLGYDEGEELLGRNMHELMHHTRVDGTPYPKEDCKVCDAFRSGKGIHVDNEMLWRSDGTSFPVEYWSYPIISDEGIMGAMVTFLDITRRRQAEEEKEELLSTLNTLVEHIPEGVFLLDIKGRVAMANPVAAEYLWALSGVSVGDRLDDLAGSPPVKLLVSPPQILWHDLEADGQIFEVGGRTMASGGAVFVMRDVTRDRETAKRLRLQERMAAVGQLAAGIAHDFNNILTVINGYAEMLLMDKDLNEESRKAIDIVSQSGERGAELIRQILDFSRQTVGEMKALDLGEFLSEFFEFIKRIIPENIRVSVELKDPGLKASADPVKLQQVMANLVVNARDAMHGGGSLTIALSGADYTGHGSDDEALPLSELAGGNWAVLTVSDTGGGIPDDVLPHVFEPFFTTKSLGEGTGLGLPQVYGLVKQHGGYINVRTSDKGTSFEVFLPLRTNGPGQQEAHGSTPVPTGKGQTVLVAEDGDSVRELITSMLSSLGYEPLGAVNGSEALEAYDSSEGPVALVITDIIMPGMDGISLAREIRKRDPNVPIIAMSGHTLEHSEKTMHEAGIAELIRKPFRIRDMADAISRYLAGGGD